jgi:hypothetical protein
MARRHTTDPRRDGEIDQDEMPEQDAPAPEGEETQEDEYVAQVIDVFGDEESAGLLPIATIQAELIGLGLTDLRRLEVLAQIRADAAKAELLMIAAEIKSREETDAQAYMEREMAYKEGMLRQQEQMTSFIAAQHAEQDDGPSPFLGFGTVSPFPGKS